MRPVPARIGGLLDSLTQAVSFDQELLDLRKQKQHARVQAATATQEKKAATERAKAAKGALRATRAETAAVKSTASRGRVQATQVRKTSVQEAGTASTDRLTEVRRRRVAEEGAARDAAERARADAQVRAEVQAQRAAETSAMLPPGVATDQALARARVATLVNQGSTNREGGVPGLAWVLSGIVIAAFGAAVIADRRAPELAIARAPRYARLNLP